MILKSVQERKMGNKVLYRRVVLSGKQERKVGIKSDVEEKESEKIKPGKLGGEMYCAAWFRGK